MARFLEVQIAHLQTFRREVESRGGMLVFTFVPYADHAPLHVARELARRTGTPYIEVWPEGLQGQLGSHMNLPSARRFVSALLDRLFADAAVRSHLNLDGIEGQRR
ncbi:MAG: hypothetical protein AB1635_00835 [Acidobacteriota bacterium]